MQCVCLVASKFTLRKNKATEAALVGCCLLQHSCTQTANVATHGSTAPRTHPDTVLYNAPDNHRAIHVVHAHLVSCAAGVCSRRSYVTMVIQACFSVSGAYLMPSLGGARLCCLPRHGGGLAGFVVLQPRGVQLLPWQSPPATPRCQLFWMAMDSNMAIQAKNGARHTAWALCPAISALFFVLTCLIERKMGAECRMSRVQWRKRASCVGVGPPVPEIVGLLLC